MRPLGDIEDEAFALVNALDATQQKAAILGSTAIDLVLGPGQDGKTIHAQGLLASQMTADQQAALLTLIGHYTGLGNAATAATRMAGIKATLDQTAFAWYGPTMVGSATYFRVTGPTIVIEFSPQGGGGPGSNAVATDLHIHGIYRDPTNDYGARYTTWTNHIHQHSLVNVRFCVVTEDQRPALASSCVPCLRFESAIDIGSHLQVVTRWRRRCLL